MNIFSSLKKYKDKWTVKETRSFTQEEINAIEGTVVKDSDYGHSVCFFMKGGGYTYIPLSNNSNLAIGDSIDLTKAKLLTLERAGDADIYRVEA